MKRNIKYQLKLFFSAAFCIWIVVLGFVWLQYKAEKDLSRTLINQCVRMAVGSLIDAHIKGLDVEDRLESLDRYFSKSDLNEISISIYDNHSKKLLMSMGDVRTATPPTALLENAESYTYPDGSRVTILGDFYIGKDKIFYYSSRTTPEGDLELRTYLPYSKQLGAMIHIKTIYWFMLVGIGLFGTVMVFFITKHQARNVALLHEFARRVATDSNFIPMGDFPPDEIGDISRQIVAVYNARIQANVRREREHVIALKAVEEKNKVKRALTNNISHELKTPIGIIHGYVEMLLAEPDMPAEDREHFLLKTQENVERIVTMLASLSTMTRLEEGANNITLKEINFHKFIESLGDEMLEGGMLGDMDFVWNIPADCEIYANEGLLTSVITNLVKNARNYSQGTEIGIDVIGKNGNYYTISFYDNGVGVGEEHLQYLFDRFYRVDVGRSRKSGGTGLGLSIVKSSINSMGGTIIVRNRRGGGLEFVFTLARVKDGQSPGHPGETDTPTTDTPTTGDNTPGDAHGNGTDAPDTDPDSGRQA